MTGSGPLSSSPSNQLWGAVPATEPDANNDRAESPEEPENTGDGADKLYMAIQKVATAMPFLTISSVALFIVFSIQAIRYHSPFTTFLALWFLVLGSQAYILYELHRINIKLEVHCCDGTDNSGNMILWFILICTLIFLPAFFISAEPMFIGKINTIEHIMNMITIALTVFFSIIWLFDTVYMISEVMPIRVD